MKFVSNAHCIHHSFERLPLFIDLEKIFWKKVAFSSKVLLHSQDIRSPTGTVLIDARSGAVVYRVEDNVTGLSFAVIWTPPDGDGPGPLVREEVNNFRRK